MRYPFNKYRLGTRYGSKGKYWKCGYHSGQDFLSANYGVFMCSTMTAT